MQDLKESIIDRLDFIYDNYLYYFFVFTIGIVINEYARVLSLLSGLTILSFIAIQLYRKRKEE